jgi:carotenoid 9,10(9',10')-cleavage dioxygenase 1
MVHAVRITPSGAATYCNRWVRTARLAAERAAGVPLFTKFGDYRGAWALIHMAVSGLRTLVGLKPKGELMDGTANTALAFHASRLLALHEGSLPHQLRVACDGLVSTVGRVFAGEVRHPFTAHPKIDPADGSMHALGYRLDKPPYLWYMQVDKEGTLVADVAIETPRPTMQHDCAIAGPYFIFVDPPLVFKPDVMAASAAKMPFVYDTDQPLVREEAGGVVVGGARGSHRDADISPPLSSPFSASACCARAPPPATTRAGLSCRRA